MIQYLYIMNNENNTHSMYTEPLIQHISTSPSRQTSGESPKRPESIIIESKSSATASDTSSIASSESKQKLSTIFDSIELHAENIQNMGISMHDNENIKHKLYITCKNIGLKQEISQPLIIYVVDKKNYEDLHSIKKYTNKYEYVTYELICDYEMMQQFPAELRTKRDILDVIYLLAVGRLKTEIKRKNHSVLDISITYSTTLPLESERQVYSLSEERPSAYDNSPSSNDASRISVKSKREDDTQIHRQFELTLHFINKRIREYSNIYTMLSDKSSLNMIELNTQLYIKETLSDIAKDDLGIYNYLRIPRYRRKRTSCIIL
jgi:hypothetical protein